MYSDSTTRDDSEHSLAQAMEEHSLLTLSELAYLAETSPAMIQQLLEWDVVVPAMREPEPAFTIETPGLVRKLLRMHAGLNIDVPSLPLVLELLQRIADLEQRLSETDPPHH